MSGASAAQRGAGTAECPEGHELLPWTAKEGSCCGCGKHFPAGEQVMDCRRCNWFLCEVCCPRYGRTPSFWGTLSQLPFYAAERLSDAFDASDAALDAFAERHDQHIDATLDAVERAVASIGHKAAKVPAMAWMSDLIFEEILDASPEEASQSAEGTEEQRQEALELVVGFCENYREVCAEPTDSDLDAFWSRCCVLYGAVLEPGPLAVALATQLQREAGPEDGSWQPPLRALCALRDFHQRGAVGQAIAVAVARRAGSSILSLAKVADCAEEAERVSLLLLGRAGALDGAWTQKSRPGVIVEVIAGTELRLLNGVTCELSPCGLNKVMANFRGRQQEGELRDGELVWNTGNVWVRHTGPMPTSKAAGMRREIASASGARGSLPLPAREPEGMEFNVVVERTDQNQNAKLGLDITFLERTALRIKKVKEGLINEWNFFNPDREVKTADWIVSVNGKRGSSERMLEEIGSAQRFELRILREMPPSGASPAASASQSATTATALAVASAATTASAAAPAETAAPTETPAAGEAEVAALIHLEPPPAVPSKALTPLIDLSPPF